MAEVYGWNGVAASTYGCIDFEPATWMARCALTVPSETSRPSSVGRGVAESIRICFSSVALSSGLTESTSAATPVTTGAELEVP